MLQERTIDWTREWREQGLEEGREQGRAEGRADVLIRQLERKFGPLEGNRFLTLVRGREHLAELGRRGLREGAQEIVFTLPDVGDDAIMDQP